MDRFEIHPVPGSALPEVAAFLYRWRGPTAAGPEVQKPALESVHSISRRLRWLLLDNPAAHAAAPLGHCVRDEFGAIRGLNLSFPGAFLAGEKRLLGLCSGSFFVDLPARSLGFYLFKKFLRTPGYSFYFASTCNANSSRLWNNLGGCPVPNSETEYLLPLKLDAVMPALVAARTSSQVAAGIARFCGRGANPVLRWLTRLPAKLTLEPCRDWDKLSSLARRHCSPRYVTSDRSPAFLEWRYGPGSPAHPCGVYLFRDELGQEGWFALGDLARTEGRPFRESVLLDLIWPRQHMSCERIFPEIARVAAASADALYFHWQPEMNFRTYSRWVIPLRLGAPRAYVSVPQGASRFPLDSFDYDDSDYIAWRFEWSRV